MKTCREEPTVLESEMKAALRVSGRNKSPEAHGLSIDVFQATETGICPNLHNMATNLENKTMAYRL